MTSQNSSQNTRATGDVFATTHWTVVLAASQRHTPEAGLALEELCRTYWFPLYAYVRRHGHSREDAEDLTQAFFAQLLACNLPAQADSDRGKFRAFLLVALKHFLANQWDKAKALKRGGGMTHLSLDWQTADTQFQVAATQQLNPDQAFDREWALALLAQVVDRLQVECEAEGRAKQFKQLKGFLTGSKGDLPHAEAASALNMDPTAVRVAVHRLRKRYRQLLREEISRTLSKPADLEEEMKALFGAFSV